ncbi:MAG TPA: SagB/ThcOx family dehydrogenase [Opitutaceae bacterium]|nr:SagB/ThcOx family dehydrogenase [Opitutaceae bacterium]
MKTVIVLLLGLVASPVFAAGLAPIKLPSPQTDIGRPLMQTLKLRRSERAFSPRPLPLQELANLLWAADGINRPESGMRTAPSAHNWEEVDIYVVLADGAYLYDAKANLLAPVAEGDLRGICGTQGFVKDAPLNLVYVTDLGRVTAKDNDDTKMVTAVDVGLVVENAYLYCASQGLAAVVRGSVDRPRLAQALKLRPNQRVMLSHTIGYPADQ